MTCQPGPVLVLVVRALLWRAARDDDAKAAVDGAGAEGELAGLERGGGIQAGVQVAELRQ